MLILSRRPNESIVIDGDIVIKLLAVRGQTVRLGIEAPPGVKILRQEIAGSLPHADRNYAGELAVSESPTP